MCHSLENSVSAASVWSAETAVKTASPSWKQTSVGLLQIPQQGPTSTVPQFSQTANFGSKLSLFDHRDHWCWDCSTCLAESLSGLYDKTVAWHRSGHEALWLFCFVLTTGLSYWNFNIQLCAFQSYKSFVTAGLLSSFKYISRIIKANSTKRIKLFQNCHL